MGEEIKYILHFLQSDRLTPALSIALHIDTTVISRLTTWYTTSLTDMWQETLTPYADRKLKCKIIPSSNFLTAHYETKIKVSLFAQYGIQISLALLTIYIFNILTDKNCNKITICIRICVVFW